MVSDQNAFNKFSLMFIFPYLLRLERLEAGARDATDFLEWQTKMKKQDLDTQLADIERRRLEGKLSHEDAILARQDLIHENRQRVKEMKEEVRLRNIYVF